MITAFFDVTSQEKEYISKKFKSGKALIFSDSLAASHVSKLKGVEVLSVFISSKVTADILMKLPAVKCVVTRSTGYDHIDLEYCKSKGIVVSNVPAYGENTVAEHTFALLLSLSRKIHQSHFRVKASNFSTEGIQGFDLKGKTLGIIGGGKIGMRAAHIATGFSMKVLVYDVFKVPFYADVLGFEYVDSLDGLLGKSDIISMHTPNLPSTHHMINMTNIKKMKKGAVILNTARGGVISADALLYGLQKGIVSAAGLDVLEDEELLTHPPMTLTPVMQNAIDRNKQILARENVLFTPHNAFNTIEALHRILEVTLQNISGFAKKAPVNLVK